MIVCHNLQFDIPFIQNEFERIGVRITPTRTFCTMEYYTDILKLKGKRGYKWPKLTEVLDYYSIEHLDISRKMGIFFGEASQAHDARWDIIATMEIYNRIADIQDTLEKVRNNKITKYKKKRYRMDKVKLINILSGILLGGFILYITLRDGDISNSIVIIVLSPLFYGFLNSLITDIIAPELVDSKPGFDCDGEL
ncbi:MAG: 3'-5' exonuclease [Paraclostridium sp.]